MILLYSFVLLVLGLVHWVVQRRAASLGRGYSTHANQVLKLLHGAPLKPGNGRTDPCAVAKQQYELGRLVLLRDRAEAKHFAWQTWADRLGKAVTTLRNWKGQKLPYTLGVLDVWLVLYAIDRVGFGDLIQPRQVIDALVALFTR
jgi:hypothetical protein